MPSMSNVSKPGVPVRRSPSYRWLSNVKLRKMVDGRLVKLLYDRSLQMQKREIDENLGTKEVSSVFRRVYSSQVEELTT